MKVLVRAPNWLGDLIMCLPAVYALRKHLPEVSITVATRKPLVPILNCTNFIDHSIPLDDKNTASSILLDLFHIKSYHFTHAFVFTNSFSSVLPLLTIPNRIGYKTDLRQFLLTKVINVPSDKKNTHEVNYYLKLVNAYLDANSDLYPVRYPEEILKPNESGNTKLLKLFDELEIGFSRPLVALHPFATYGSAKKWPLERFVSLIVGLFEKLKVVTFLIIGVETQFREAGVLVGKLPESVRKKTYNLCGKTDLETLVSLLSECDLLVTNDSGPMHVASALNKPLVAIFGSTNPTTTGPLSEKSIVVRGEAPCSPCFLRDCPRNLECMESISVEEVIKACVYLLGG